MHHPPSATILVVDDEPPVLDLLRTHLEAEGYRVVTAAGGREALALLAEHAPDLVLLDVLLPDLGGVAVLREIRKARPACDLPVIMATAQAGGDQVVRALDAGASDYVVKPFDLPVLLARVQAQLRRTVRADAPPHPSAGAGPAAPTKGGALTPGARVAGRYEIVARIGTGGFGTVYRAKHLRVPRQVAIKVLHGDWAQDPKMRARFQREAEATCRISHPNAVTAFDYDVTPEGLAFLVMELLEGRPLSDHLLSERKLTANRTARIMMPVCEVLECAHRAGVIHRDLKPSNVFLSEAHGRQGVKVLDFGMAKVVVQGDEPTPRPLTEEGTVLGTPEYMAPERILNQTCDGRCDVYSLGVMMFEMLAGRLPFVTFKGALAAASMHIKEPPPRVREFAPEVPEKLEGLILQTMAKVPGQRPSAAAVEATLAEFARAGGA